KTVVDLQLFSTVLELTGSHAFDLDEKVMQPPRSRKSGIQGGIKQSRLLVQQPLGMFQAEKLKKLLWRHPGPLAKHPLKMKGTHVHMRGGFLQRRLPLEVHSIKIDRSCYAIKIDFLLCFHTVFVFMEQIYPGAGCPETRFLRYKKFLKKRISC